MINKLMYRPRIKQTVLLPLIASLLLLFIIYVGATYWRLYNDIDEGVNKSLQSVNEIFRLHVKRNAAQMKSLLEIIAAGEDYAEAFRARDRQLLYERSAPLFESLKATHGVTHLYFSDTNRVNFLRVHRPEQFGDTIPRITTKRALETLQVTHGIEIGLLRGLFTLRVVKPYYVDGKFSGLLEMGKEIEFITGSIHDILDVDLAVFAKKEYLVRDNWEAGMRFLGRNYQWDQFKDYVVVEINAPGVLQLVNNNLSNKQIGNNGSGFDISGNKRHLRGGFISIFDAGNRIVGYVLVINDVSHQLAQVHQSLIVLGLIVLALSGLLVVFFIFFLGNVEKDMIFADQRLGLQGVALESANSAIMITNRQGKIEWVNTAFTKLTGYQKQDVIGKYQRFLYPDSMYENIRDAVFYGKAWNGEIVNKRKDGSTFVEELSLTPVHDSEAGLTHFISIKHDITKYKITEQAFRESEERLYNVTANVMAFLWTAKVINNTEFQYQLYTENVKAISGYRAEEFLKDEKNLWLSLIHAADICFVEQAIQKLLTGETAKGEYRIRRKDGQIRWVYDIATPKLDDRGKVTFIHGVCFDITERKMFEHQLEAEKERLIVTLRSIGDGVLTVSAERKVVLMNRAAEKITGWKQEEINGKSVNKIFKLVKQNNKKKWVNLVNRALKSGNQSILTEDGILISRDGLERHIEATAAPFQDKSGDTIGVVIAFKDNTNKKVLEKELLKVQKLESLAVLAGGIAHDFNNYLTAILGNISLLRLQVPDDERISKILSAAERASLKAEDLTQQLMTLSKGRVSNRVPMKLEELIHSSAEFVLRGSKIRCRFDLPADLFWICADEGQIGQVLNNLLINSMQAMPDGGIVVIKGENVTIKQREDLLLNPGDYVKVSVEDSGVGIARENLHKIFDPYFTTKQKGSGLGLATSYSIIREHSGYMNVRSELGKGTTIAFYLPAAKAVPQEEKTQKEEPQKLSQKKRILVMDDDQLVREIAAQILSTIGCEVTLTADGREMLSKYEKACQHKNPFDAVIMDLTVPGGMGGKEAVEELLKLDPSAVAIVSSGYFNDPVMAEFKKYGFSEVVTKPYSVEKMSSVINKLLN